MEHVSPLAAELAEDALERFLRYARIDTQAAHGSDSAPSTSKQLDLARLLADELRELGASDVAMNDAGVVTAMIPGDPGAPVIGLLAHVDTAPDASGTGVEPIVHRAWDGTPIVLPGDPSQVLDPAAYPELAARVGHDLVTSDGTTLLGADDKAGVAAIMAAAGHLLRTARSGPRATIRVAFTTDEEIGRGTDHLDLEAFGARAAYTLDGSGAPSLEAETWSADAAEVVIGGVPVHPGYAKDKLVNAIKLAARYVASLPADALSPETTSGREGFVHPYAIEGTEQRAVVHLILRDFEENGLAEQAALLERLADELRASEPRASVEVAFRQQYRNMRDALREAPEVVAAAEEAYRRVGLEARHEAIRGGTDGSVLTAKGLPTPNVFAGGQEFHSVREWLSVHDMAAASAVAVELASVWGSDPLRNAGGGSDPLRNTR